MKTQLAPAFLLGPALSLLMLATSSPAQLPAEGLFLTATGSTAGLYRLGTWPSATRLNTLSLRGLKVDTSNAGFVAALPRPFPSGSAIVRVSKSGVMTSFANLPLGKRGADIAVDQDGSYIIPSAGVIYRLGQSGRTTFSTATGAWQAIDRDDSTGGFVVGSSTGTLLSLRRYDGMVLRTIATNLGTLTDVAYNPANNSYVVSRLGTMAGVLILSSFGRPITTIHLSNATAVTVDEKNGDVWLASTDAIVVQTDSTGVVKSTGRYTMSTVTGIDIGEDQNVSLKTSGELGTWAQVTLTFRRHLGWRYVCALALAQRPGIPLPGGRVQNLAPDALWYLTANNLLPGITQNLHGVINPRTGQAFPRFLILAGLPVSLRIYVGAVVWKPGLSTIEPGNVEVIMTQQTPT